MLKKLLRLINRKEDEGGMHQAAILLGVFSLTSQLIGLWRDRMLAHQIGPGQLLDVYYAAFRIPDFIYLSIASLASITVLMPFLIEHINGSGKESARKFFNDVLSGFFLLLTLVSIIVYFLMPKLAYLIAPGFTPEQLHTLIGASRLMLLSPIFMGLSNMLGTVTQLMRKFVVFSLSPIFYNIGIVFGIYFLYPKFGVYGLAGGVAIGALLHLLIQVPTIIKAGFTPKLVAKLEHSTLRQVVSLSLPRTLGLSMNSIALLVILAMASKLSPGSISIFNFSLNLETVPVGIIGISYAVASFPLLAEAYASGDKEKWQKNILSAIKQIIFWSLPLAALFIVLRAQIVRVALGSGAFSWNDTKLTAAAFALFTLGLVAQNLILVSVRAFYSAHNTKTPLVINAFSSIVIVGLAWGLLHLFNASPVFRYFIESVMRVSDIPGTAVLMLPLAYSIGTLLNAWLNWVDLRKQYITEVGNLPRTLFESISAAFAVGVVTYASLNAFSHVFDLNTTIGIFLQGSIACIFGTLAGFILLYGLKSESLFEFLGAVRKKFWKVDFVEPEK